MVFSSIIFISAFLPITFALYFLPLGKVYKNAVLILASLVFYAFGEPVFVFLMVCSALLNYVFGLVISKQKEKSGGAKALLAIDVILNIAFLGVYKYASFAVGTVNSVFRLGIPLPNITLPIGISFFTFQAMSYVIDVYRDRSIVQKNFAKVLLYISFFPQLIAGPIVRFGDIKDQLDRRDGFDSDRISSGLMRFSKGLAKKILIANCAGSVADMVYALDSSYICAPTAWLGAFCYFLQIYYDFSGYSDMALGLAKVFGFKFPENFDHPYSSLSLKEFWRRWHISLSTWFREYVYIPLGGNRKGKIRTEVNKLIVFFLTGLWHGANWTFVIWGLYNGVILIIEDLIGRGKKDAPKKLPVLSNIFTCIIVIVGFVFFRADSLSGAVFMLRQMFTGFSFDRVSLGYALGELSPYTVTVLTAGMVFAYPVSSLLGKKIEKRKWYGALVSAGSLLLLVLCILNLASSAYNPFIYFRF